MTDAGNAWLTPKELAAKFKVPLATVYRWNTTGTGPKFVSIGKHVRYRTDDIQAWVDARGAWHGVDATARELESKELGGDVPSSMDNLDDLLVAPHHDPRQPR